MSFVSGTKVASRMKSEMGRSPWPSIAGAMRSLMWAMPTTPSWSSWNTGTREKPVWHSSASTSDTVWMSSTIVTSTRGTMTSRAEASPRSNTSWMMRFSSSSRVSCSLIMYLISSSETFWRSSPLLMRIRRARPFAEAWVSHTSGRAIFWKTVSGCATRFAMPSASARAMRFGTSSPTTMERYDTISVMSTGASAGAAAVRGATPKLDSHWASGSERLVEATADEAKPTSVMATWMVARKLPESAASSAARAARRSPSSASWSSTARFAVVSAISDMEKYPLMTVRTSVVIILMVMSMGTVSNLLGCCAMWGRVQKCTCW